mgnify:CR=1 FL=1
MYICKSVFSLIFRDVNEYGTMYAPIDNCLLMHSIIDKKHSRRSNKIQSYIKAIPAAT